MSTADLLVLYLLAGLGCAVAAWRRTERRGASQLGSSLMALVLWPLWAPFVLVDAARPASTPRSERTDVGDRGRVERALEEALRAAAGTPFEAMLDAAAAERMAREMALARERLGEIEALLSQTAFDRDGAEARVSELIREGASPTAVRTAQVHLANLQRLERVREGRARALSEVEQVLVALRSQLLVARYADSTGEGVGDIVCELWSRVEGLGEVLDAQDELVPPPPGATEQDHERAHPGGR